MPLARSAATDASASGEKRRRQAASSRVRSGASSRRVAAGRASTSAARPPSQALMASDVDRVGGHREQLRLGRARVPGQAGRDDEEAEQQRQRGEHRRGGEPPRGQPGGAQRGRPQHRQASAGHGHQRERAEQQPVEQAQPPDGAEAGAEHVADHRGVERGPERGAGGVGALEDDAERRRDEAEHHGPDRQAAEARGERVGGVRPLRPGAARRAQPRQPDGGEEDHAAHGEARSPGSRARARRRRRRWWRARRRPRRSARRRWRPERRRPRRR